MDKITTRKTKYINDLLLRDKEKALILSKKDFNQPIFKPIDYHSEEEPNLVEIEEDFETVLVDLNGIQEEIANTTQEYADLLISSKEKIQEIDKIILDLDNKLQDINLLCGNLTEFDTIISLDDSDFTGNFSYKGNSFANYLQEDYPISYEIVSISGNGYAGNSFVLTSEGVAADSIVDAANHSNITDESILTYYDYSRICSGENELVNNDFINYDDFPCKCIVHIKADSGTFNTLRINTEVPDLTIHSVLTEDENGSFVEALDDIILINQSSEENIEGIYTNGFIYFPSTSQAKVTFMSDYSFTNEVINMDVNKIDNV